MSWKIAILVALVTAIVSGVITAPVADQETIRMKVSNFEGGRGYLVVFLVLAALVGGLIIGLVATRWVGALEWIQYWKAQGAALLASVVVIGVIAGLCLLSIPRPLLLNGELIALDFEILLPEPLAPDTFSGDAHIRVSLYANSDDNSYVGLDPSKIRRTAGTVVIPGEAPLNSLSGTRMLTLIVRDSTSYTLDVPLRPMPGAEDLEWTKPYPMRHSNVQNNTYEYTEVMVRYRVVKKGAPQE